MSSQDDYDGPLVSKNSDSNALEELTVTKKPASGIINGDHSVIHIVYFIIPTENLSQNSPRAKGKYNITDFIKTKIRNWKNTTLSVFNAGFAENAIAMDCAMLKVFSGENTDTTNISEQDSRSATIANTDPSIAPDASRLSTTTSMDDSVDIPGSTGDKQSSTKSDMVGDDSILGIYINFLNLWMFYNALEYKKRQNLFDIYEHRYNRSVDIVNNLVDELSYLKTNLCNIRQDFTEKKTYLEDQAENFDPTITYKPLNVDYIKTTDPSTGKLMGDLEFTSKDKGNKEMNNLMRHLNCSSDMFNGKDSKSSLQLKLTEMLTLIENSGREDLTTAKLEKTLDIQKDSYNSENGKTYYYRNNVNKMIFETPVDLLQDTVDQNNLLSGDKITGGALKSMLKIIFPDTKEESNKILRNKINKIVPIISKIRNDISKNSFSSLTSRKSKEAIQTENRVDDTGIGQEVTEQPTPPPPGSITLSAEKPEHDFDPNLIINTASTLELSELDDILKMNHIKEYNLIYDFNTFTFNVRLAAQQHPYWKILSTKDQTTIYFTVHLDDNNYICLIKTVPSDQRPSQKILVAINKVEYGAVTYDGIWYYVNTILHDISTTTVADGGQSHSTLKRTNSSLL